MHKGRGIALVGVAWLGLLMTGCAAAPTRLESTYGTAYHFARAAQTLSPKAGTPIVPVQGVDGKAAKHVLDRYRAMFEQPPPPPSFVISVGGIK
jgi:hypothetical protein